MEKKEDERELQLFGGIFGCFCSAALLWVCVSIKCVWLESVVCALHRHHHREWGTRQYSHFCTLNCRCLPFVQSKDGTNKTHKINNFARRIISVERFIIIKYCTDLSMDCLSSRIYYWFLIRLWTLSGKIHMRPICYLIYVVIYDPYWPCATILVFAKLQLPYSQCVDGTTWTYSYRLTRNNILRAHL